MLETLAAQLQPYHPTTFLERGVAVLFTTPMLAGTRARPMERAKGKHAKGEAAARAMRAREATGRRLGGGDAYPTMLRAAAAKIGDPDPASPLTRVDRAWLVELLAGTDAALALVNA